MGFSAINTNNNLVFITVSLMLAVMGISGFFGKANIENLSIELSFEDEIYALKKTKIKINITNNKSTIFSALLNINIIGESGKVFFLKPKQSLSIYVRKTFTERGLVKIDNIIVSSPYPFNFFVRAKVYTINKTFVVFPRLINNKFILNSYNKKEDTSSDHIDMAERKNQEELSNIRSYYNDPMNRIFWKHYPKNENLYTKEFASEDVACMYLIFEDLINTYDQEMGVSVAATIIFEMSFKRQPLIFQFGNKKYNILNIYEKREALKELALYGKY